MAIKIPDGFEVKPDGSIGPVATGGFDAAFGGPPPAPVPQPPPIQTVNGTNINNTSQSPAPNATDSNPPGPIQYPPYGPQLQPKSRPQYPQAPPGLSDAATWLWSHMPTPTYNPAQHGPSKNPINNPIVFAGQPPDAGGWNEAFNPKKQTAPFTALAPRGGGQQAAAPSQAGGGAYGSPWDPQGVGYAVSQRLAQQQNPWDPQGAGYAASQRLAQQPVQGPLAALAPQQSSSPFTMIMRPNAPANNQGGRGGGGTPLTTALDLSGYQAPAPSAPPSYNLGYGGGGRAPPSARTAPSRMRSQAPQDPGSAFWETSGAGAGLPALRGNGFWNIFGSGVGIPRAGKGFYNTFGPGVGMPAPGPVNQPGFWGVHGRGVGFRGNQ